MTERYEKATTVRELIAALNTVPEHMLDSPVFATEQMHGFNVTDVYIYDLIDGQGNREQGIQLIGHEGL